MERIEIYIILIVVGSVIGLIATADNEPTPIIIENNLDKPHFVDAIPGERSIHNKTIIKNPNITFTKCNPDTGMSYEKYNIGGSGSGGCVLNDFNK